MTIYTALKPLQPDRPVDVIERDEQGALVGAWHGYWNFKRGTVALYPNGKNRYVSWPGGVLPLKRVVSDRVILIRNSKFEIQNGTDLPLHNGGSSEDEAYGGVQEQIQFN